MEHALKCAAIGSLDTITQQTQAFIDKTGADELMVTCNMFDQQARLESYALLAQAHKQLRPAPTVNL